MFLKSQIFKNMPWKCRRMHLRASKTLWLLGALSGPQTPRCKRLRAFGPRRKWRYGPWANPWYNWAICYLCYRNLAMSKQWFLNSFSKCSMSPYNMYIWMIIHPKYLLWKIKFSALNVKEKNFSALNFTEKIFSALRTVEKNFTAQENLPLSPSWISHGRCLRRNWLFRFIFFILDVYCYD